MGGSAIRGIVETFISNGRAHWGYFAGLSLACILIVGITLQNYRAIDRELTAAALARRASVSDLAAATLSEKFARLMDIGISLATRVRFGQLVAAGKWDQAGEILRAVPRDFPFIDRLFLTDTKGTLTADIPELPGVKDRNFAYRDWYQGVSRGWRPYVSPVYRRAAAPQRNVFAVAVPIRDDDGKVSGILVLQARLDTFFEWAKAIEGGDGGFVYIVDTGGQVAFHSKFPDRDEIVEFSAAPTVQRVLRGARGVEIVFDPIERENSVSAYTPVSRYGWGVIVQQPAQAAFAVRDQQLARLLAAYGLILLFCAAVVYLASRVVVQRRRAQEDLRVKTELEHRVAERTAQLKTANRELESFSYTVSHDLRTPLRAIDGFSRMLEEDYNDKLDDEARRLISVVRQNSRKMAHLIDDLLEFSRLGRKPLTASAIDMTQMAGEVFEELAANGDHRPLKLKLNPLPAAWGDPVLVRQAWVNLLSNAIKFTGGREQPEIEVHGHAENGRNVYCVKDNGAGFDMNYGHKLFGVFQRLHSAEEFPGTGVGLAIVQRVITRHGGQVWAEGTVDAGATFYFSLPEGERNG